MPRRLMAAAAGALLLAGSVATGAIPASAITPAEQDFSGVAEGHAVYLNTAVAQVADVAWSGATVASKGHTGEYKNEMAEVVRPALPVAGQAKLQGRNSYARGSGVELLNNDSLRIQRVRVSAGPPLTESDANQLLRPAVNGVLFAEVLRGQAVANWDDKNCILGKPISEGVGFADDTQLVGTSNPDGTLANPLVALDAGNPTNRRVVQSLSRQILVPQTKADGKTVIGQNLALRAETRQILAPVTLFKGAPNETTIQIAGEWVLQAVAGGVAEGGYVQYGPNPGSVTTPVLTIIQGGNVTQQINLQQITGANGLNVPIPGVGEIVIGEQPRALGGATGSKPAIAANGTSVAAAVDVARVKITAGNLLDLRIGHMEAQANVPVGGIQCELPVKKSVNPTEVLAGQKFTYTITVENPFDCVLNKVRVVDTISVNNRAIKFTVGTTTPPNNGVVPITNEPAVRGFIPAQRVTWNDIGPINPKQSKQLLVPIDVAPDSAAGIISDTAVATGECAFGQASGAAGVVVPLRGQVTLDAPNVTAPELPQTGSDGRILLIGGGLLALAIVARRPQAVLGRIARR